MKDSRNGLRPDEIGEELRRLGQLLDGQQRLIEQLAAMGAEQSRLVDENQGEELLAHLDGRQELIDKLAGLSEPASELRAKHAAVLAEESHPLAGGINDKLRAFAGAADAVAARALADEQRLRVKRDAVAEELSRVGSGKRAVSAYGPGTVGEEAKPRFQDRTV